MKCIIDTFLESDMDRLKEKNIAVIARYIKTKFRIDISLKAMQQKMNLCLEKQYYRYQKN
jgi:hypothetical protein